MSFKERTLLTLLTGALFTLASTTLFAQYPGMAAFRVQQNAQFMNQQMQMQMRMMNIRGVTSGPVEYDFEVTLKDSSKIQFTSTILSDSLKRHFLVYEDKKYKRKDTGRYKFIYPLQTSLLVCIVGSLGDDSTPPRYFRGKPTDSCWMFIAIAGKINVYSYYPGVDGSDPSTFVGLQVNEGPIVQYTLGNIKTMIADDPNAIKYFENKKYVKAIKKYDDDMQSAALSH